MGKEEDEELMVEDVEEDREEETEFKKQKPVILSYWKIYH